MRQVTHALLTRPPLSHKRLQTEVICLKCFVRLACVKHAASVHPEPGSNSHKNVFLSETHARLLTQLAKFLKTRVLNPVSFELTSFNSFLILCLRISFNLLNDVHKRCILNSNEFCTHLEILKRIFKVVFLFSYQSSVLKEPCIYQCFFKFLSLPYRGDLIIIAPPLTYVNTFFEKMLFFLFYFSSHYI